MIQEIKKQLLSFLLSCSTTAVGIFIALWVNTHLDDKKEHRAFNTKKKMLLHEITMNETILDSSFVKFAARERGVIFAELTTHISSDLLRDQNFIGETNDSLMTLLQTYHKQVGFLIISRDELNTIRKAKLDGQSNYNSDLEHLFAENIILRRNLLASTFNAIRRNAKITDEETNN